MVITDVKRTAAPLEGANLLSTVQQQFDEAADLLDLPANLRRILRVPQRELTVNFPVKRDDGRIEVFQGFRVQRRSIQGRLFHSRHPETQAPSVPSHAHSGC